MKQLARIVLMVAVALLTFALARSVAIIAAPERPAVVVEATHQLGRIAVGEARTISVNLSNSGNAELLVTEVKGNCECSVAAMSSRVIAPGGTVPLKVTVKPKKPGRRKQQLMIRSNDPVHPVTMLTITADVYEAPGTRPATGRLAERRRVDEAEDHHRLHSGAAAVDRGWGGVAVGRAMVGRAGDPAGAKGGEAAL